jgi:predicted dehydrogenase
MLASGVIGNMLSIKAVLTWSRGGAYYTDSPWRGRFSTEGRQPAYQSGDPHPGSDAVVRRRHSRAQRCGGQPFLTDVTENEDTAMASMKLANGARGLFYASNGHSTDSPLLLEIHCEKGLLQLHHNTLWLIEGETRTLLVNDLSPAGNTKSYWGDSHRQAIINFTHSVQYPEDKNYTSLADAEISLNMVEAIYRSSQLRQWIND